MGLIKHRAMTLLKSTSPFMFKNSVFKQFDKICFASLDIAKYLHTNFAREKEPLFILSVKDYADRDFCNMINLYEKQENRRLIPYHPDHCVRLKITRFYTHIAVIYEQVLCLSYGHIDRRRQRQNCGNFCKLLK
jgi:hypothetical protein